MGASCIITPKAKNGKPSKLFADTYRHTSDREVSKTVWGVNDLNIKLLLLFSVYRRAHAPQHHTKFLA